MMSMVAVSGGLNRAQSVAGLSPSAAADATVLAAPFAGDRAFWIKGNPWSTDLLMYRGAAIRGDVAIKVVSQDGHVRLALKPFDDLRKAGIAKISLWDAIVRRDGGVSYVGVVIHDSKSGEQPRASQLMAHYSANGILSRVWDMDPYHHHLIAADRHDNIYAFGHRVDGNNKPPYPLLMRYSEDGAVKATLLTAADIGESKEPDLFVDSGAHELLSAGDSIVLLLRPKNELVEFRNGARTHRSMAELAAPWFGRSRPDEIWAGMLTQDRDGKGFLAYTLAISLFPDSAQTGSKAAQHPPLFLRVQPGLRPAGPVELIGGPGPVPVGGRLLDDAEEYLRFAAVQADGSVRITQQRKLNSRK